jgi:hypothetical protein
MNPNHDPKTGQFASLDLGDTITPRISAGSIGIVRGVKYEVVAKVGNRLVSLHDPVSGKTIQNVDAATLHQKAGLAPPTMVAGTLQLPTAVKGSSSTGIRGATKSDPLGLLSGENRPGLYRDGGRIPSHAPVTVPHRKK